ncbi:hypothetical protein ANCDUO_26708 [Ancylostoma duodenale]|uniref:Glycosyltransferase family 92 protein n=1 Tax=Ancylostoma duodenale TaxID=51022 RepID=A0A0C2F8Q6_9BILA|nr:hypothetical protein ANCDUO_26708 [Ancylostoma duodenale]
MHGKEGILNRTAQATPIRLLLVNKRVFSGLVIIRTWPKWPILSDSNPNGLVLSRGIEESHVNCLFFAKPWANMIVFSDIDDLLLPTDPMHVKPGINVEILKVSPNDDVILKPRHPAKH